MKYLYTAIFTPIEDGTGFYARVPDLPGCISTGSDLPDAIRQISDAMSVWLVTAEDEGLSIPAATRQSDLSISPDSACSLIVADTLAYRAKIDSRAIRKNVSLPAWMAALADQRGINCSQVLQDGLMQQFSHS